MLLLSQATEGGSNYRTPLLLNVPMIEGQNTTEDATSPLARNASLIGLERQSKRPKWHLLYFVLAAFDVLTVSASLYLNHTLMDSFSDSVEVNRKWASRLGLYSDLAGLATDVNMPGNEVFDTLDVTGEVAEQREALSQFESSLQFARHDLQRNVEASESAPLLDQLDKVAEAMSQMTAVQSEIFDHFRNDEADLAGAKMATMDRKNANVAAAIGDMGVLVREIQDRNFNVQAEQAQFVRSMEVLIAVMIVLMVVAVTVYGHKIAQQVKKSDESLQAALHEARRQSERATSALREVEALWKALNQHTLLSVTDRSGKIIDANEGFCRISGFTREELLGNDHRIVNSGHHPKSFWIDMWKTIAAGEVWREEVCNRAKDGSIYWVDSTNIPQFDAAGKIDRYISLRFDITDRKVAEAELLLTREQLAEQQDRFEHAVSGTSDGLFDQDLKTGSVWYSDQFKKLVGLAVEDFDSFEPVIASFIDLVHPQDKDEVLHAIEKHVEHSHPYNVEYRLKMASGEYRWFRTRGQATRCPDGQAVRISGSITDVDEHHTAQSRLALATRAASIGLWDWDILAGEMYFSDTFISMLGYDSDELPMTPDTWAKLTHPDDIELAQANIEQHLKGQTPVYLNERRLRRKDGSWLWVRDMGEVVERSSDGTPTRMIGTQVDTNASTRRGIAIENAAALSVGDTEHETLTNLASAVAKVFGVDFAGVARQSVDSEGCETARMVGGWLHGKAVEPFTYPLEGSPCAAAINKSFCLEERGVVDSYPEDKLLAEMQAESYAGIRLVSTRGEPIGILMMVHSAPISNELDVNATLGVFAARAAAELERADSEAELMVAKEAAEQANLAKSEFLANMSHEIRTPMTAILGYTDLLLGNQDWDACTPEQRDALTTIHRNGEHLLTIINDILDMSKIEAGKMTVEEVDTHPIEIVDEVVSLLQARVQGKGLSLDIKYDSPVPETIHSDPTRLRQILLNLVGNAIKFTEVGGVTIGVAYEDSSNTLEFRVTDTGIGMKPEQRDAIARFDAFSQADNSTTRNFGGSGLGLRISNCLAQILGGSTDVESAVGHGSTFTAAIATGDVSGTRLITPGETRQSDNADKPDVNAAKTNENRLQNTRLLLAEDGPDNQRLISFILKKAGADVTLAENGQLAYEAAIAALKSGEPFNAILMDMQMPILDGYSATSKLRNDGYTHPIIALTAHAMAGDRDKCLNAGCDDFATKPIDRDALISTIASYAKPAFEFAGG